VPPPPEIFHLPAAAADLCKKAAAASERSGGGGGEGTTVSTQRTVWRTPPSLQRLACEKRLFLNHFSRCENDPFTQTGSGQTQEMLRRNGFFVQAAEANAQR
jgi:hypothetical protein